jgi:hypothetical protein
MKTSIAIIGIIVALAVGVGAGYSLGKSMNNADTAKAKELQDSITMMKDQAASIKKMAELMKSGGASLQEIGMKYMDDAAVAKGQDLATVGEKYVKENEKAATGNTMNKMMGN